MPEHGGNALQRGVESGTTMFSNLLGRGLQQAQMRQAWQEHLHNLEIQRQQQARLAEAHQLAKELHPFQVRALERTEQNAPLELDLLKARINAQNQLAAQRSPEYLKKQYEALNQAFGQSSPNNGQVTAPSQDMIMRGLMKKQLGFDPFAPTEEQKKENRLNEFKEKEAIKEENKARLKSNEDLFTPTKQMINQAQKTILAINTIKPLLEDLMKTTTVPGKFEEKFKPAKKAFATMLQNLGTEEFQSVFSLPKDQHSVKMVEEMVDRVMFESPEEYRARINDLYKRVMHKGKASHDMLANKKVSFDMPSETEGTQNDRLGLF